MPEASLTCRSLAPLVSDFLDGALTEGALDAFEEHVGFCDDCVDYIAQIRVAMRLVRELPPAAPDSEDPR